MNNANYWRAVPLAHIMIVTTVITVITVGTPKAKALDQRVETQIEAIDVLRADVIEIRDALKRG